MENGEADPARSEVIAGLGLSSIEMAGLIADALVDAGLIESASFDRCCEIAEEEISIRKTLLDSDARGE